MSKSASVDVISPKIDMSKMGGVVRTALARLFCQHSNWFSVFFLSPASHESENKQWNCTDWEVQNVKTEKL